MFYTLMTSDPGYYIATIVIVGFSICVHEYAHAETAYQLGDDTAAQAGHLTLNPLVQMGPMSLVMLCLLGIAWGAVPVDERRLRKPEYGLWVSAAGPLSNVALSAIFAVISVVAARLGVDPEIVRMLGIGAIMNGALFILNMLPVPPLDGFRILSGFIPALRNLSPQVVSQMSFFLILVIFLTDVFQFVFLGGAMMAQVFENGANIVLGLLLPS